MFKELASMLREPECSAKQCLCRGCSQAYDDLRLHDGYFAFEPRLARADLPRVRLLVNAALTSFLKLEVLDGIRNVNRFAVDTRFEQCLFEHSSCGPHEGTSLEILVIAWLFTDEYDASPFGSFSKNGLRCMTIQIATMALLDSRPEISQSGASGDQVRRLPILFLCSHAKK